MPISVKLEAMENFLETIDQAIRDLERVKRTLVDCSKIMKGETTDDSGN